MTRIAIDQILQATTPTRSAADSSNSTDAARFQKHLQKATTPEKPTPPPKSNESQATEDDSDLVVSAEQEQDASPEQNNAITPAVEGDETTEPIAEETVTTVDADDLVISGVIIAAAGSIAASEISTEAEIATAAIVQPDLADANPDANGETTSFSKGKGEFASSEGFAEELIAPVADENTPTNSEISKQSNLPATSETTGELMDAEGTQQNSQATQPVVNENAPTQEFKKSSSQPLKAESALETPTLVDEVEPTTESKPKAEAKAANGLVTALETADQKFTTLDTDAEPDSATHGASSKANATKAEANTHIESAQTLGKAQPSSPVEQSPTTSEAPAESASMSTVDRARFVQRVSGAFRTAKDQNGLVQLKLSPPELGTLRIEITVKQGALTAQLETETAAARTILLDNLPALRERLAEQEIRIDKFDVDVREEGRQQQENPGAENRRSSNNTGKATTRTASQSEDHGSLPSTPTRQSGLVDSLDVMI